MLSRSLTRQASDWIMLKKQLAQFDEEYKWSQVRDNVLFLCNLLFMYTVVFILFCGDTCIHNHTDYFFIIINHR